jgi:hypothetical protein
MTTGEIQSLDIQISRELFQYWGWFLAFGIGLLLLGIIAVVRSATATIVSMLFFGWLLVLASGIEFAQAVLVAHWAGFYQHLLAANLFGVTGLLIVTRPVVSAEVMTVIMAMLSTCRLAGDCAAGMGLACSRRRPHVCAGLARSGAMACFRALGDRAFRHLDLIFYGLVWIAVALGLRAM